MKSTRLIPFTFAFLLAGTAVQACCFLPLLNPVNWFNPYGPWGQGYGGYGCCPQMCQPAYPQPGYQAIRQPIYQPATNNCCQPTPQMQAYQVPVTTYRPVTQYVPHTTYRTQYRMVQPQVAAPYTPMQPAVAYGAPIYQPQLPAYSYQTTPPVQTYPQGQTYPPAIQHTVPAQPQPFRRSGPIATPAAGDISGDHELPRQSSRAPVIFNRYSQTRPPVRQVSYGIPPAPAARYGGTVR